jgi:hypothetical protein
MAKAIDTRRHRAALPAFTPSAVSAESLAMRTVGRDAEIERLVRAIRTAATTDNRPHQLIVGPRGSGKSHLLIVALREALAEEQIADRVAVAMLPEDAVEVAGYEDLLVSIVDRAPGAEQASRETARDLRVRRDLAGLEHLVLEQLGGRVLVLVVENLDRVFRDLGDIGQARLRNLAETSARVLLLASTPLLFDAVSDHEQPWYGSFDVEHLRELDAEQGRDLLRRVATAAGDDDLAASLDTPTGLARVKAVEHLAGGSPRMWTVLAGCITVELLDELVPLVESLFDELAPYYQQRLWELAGVERKLVYELCRVPSATVKDLAHATGLTQRAAATSLGRLHDARWVRREKRRGTDQRATWYSLREPLLRHHVEYRETREERLPAIVGFLRNWYETRELAAHLGGVTPASLAETYLVAALSGEERVAWIGAWPSSMQNPDDLISAARWWIIGRGSGGLASFPAGIVVEAVGVCVRDGAAAAADTVAKRLAQTDDVAAVRLARTVDAALLAIGAVDDPIEACRRGLLAAGDSSADCAARDRIALGLVAHAMGRTFPHPEWFEAHQATVDALPADELRLRLTFGSLRALARAFWVPAETVDAASDMLLACMRDLGELDPITQYLAAEGIGLCAWKRCEGQRRFSEIAVRLMELAPSGRALQSLLVTLRFVHEATRSADEHVTQEWVGMWVEVTGESKHLTALHMLMVSNAIEVDGVSIIERLPSVDRVWVASVFEPAVARMRALAVSE